MNTPFGVPTGDEAHIHNDDYVRSRKDNLILTKKDRDSLIEFALPTLRDATPAGRQRYIVGFVQGVKEEGKHSTEDIAEVALILNQLAEGLADGAMVSEWLSHPEGESNS